MKRSNDIKKFSRNVLTKNPPPSIRRVAGADIATCRDSNRAYAGIIVMNYPERESVENVNADVALNYDCRGFFHPRRFGVAWRIGLLLNRLTSGCAKLCRTGSRDARRPRQGSTADLLDQQGSMIWSVSRTIHRVSLVSISGGYTSTLECARHDALACCRGCRISEATR